MLKTIKDKKKTRMRQFRKKRTKVEFHGLCLTCNHNATCTFPRNPEQPVLHCEEFDDSTKPITTEINTSATPQVISTDTKKKDSIKYKGLCVNCENRASCKLPKPETGVWHCEEYL